MTFSWQCYVHSFYFLLQKLPTFAAVMAARPPAGPPPLQAQGVPKPPPGPPPPLAQVAQPPPTVPVVRTPSQTQIDLRALEVGGPINVSLAFSPAPPPVQPSPPPVQPAPPSAVAPVPIGDRARSAPVAAASASERKLPPPGVGVGVGPSQASVANQIGPSMALQRQNSIPALMSASHAERERRMKAKREQMAAMGPKAIGRMTLNRTMAAALGMSVKKSRGLHFCVVFALWVFVFRLIFVHILI